MRAVLAAASGLVLAVVFFGSAPRRTFAAPAQTNARPVAYVPVPAFDLAQPGQQIVYAQQAASPPPPEWLYAAAGALVGAGAAAAWSQRRAPAPRMQETGPEAEKEAAEAPKEAPAPAPAPAEKKFDITDYSMTITIATVFLIVKGLSALGIPIGPQGR